MRNGSVSTLCRPSTRHGIPAAVRVAVLLGMLAAPLARHAEAQGVPAGTVIRSWATASFELNSVSFTLFSDTADVVVAQVGGVDLEPPRVTSSTINTSVLLQQVLTNVGNGPDGFTVTVTSARGWPVTLFTDLNEDGQINGADAPVAGSVAVGYLGHAALLAQVTVPNDPALQGQSDTVLVTATSLFDSGKSDQLSHRIDITTAPLTVAMSKAVDLLTALPGDIMTYTLSYDILGVGLTSSLQIQDTVPTGIGYLPGTLRLNGSALSDAAGDDAGTVTSGNGIITVDLGSVAAGASGTVTFQVRTNPGPPRTVTNRANAIYSSLGVTDTVISNDAVTSVVASDLSLAKDLVSPAAASIGEDVRYTFRYANLSSINTVPGAVVVDTLPAGLDYVSASVAPTVAGSVLSWSLGSLTPGQSGTIDLVTRVNNAVRDTNWVRNTASLSSSLPGATPLAATAAQVALIGPAGNALVVDLTADLLQVALGDVIPFTAVVRNTGLSAVSQIVLTVTLPSDGRYARSSMSGADSVRIVGNQLLIYSAVALAPAGARTLHFGVALTSASSPVVQVRAFATAQIAAATTTSAEAIALVQVRRASPMESRAAIGKVWVDAEGDGGQGAGDAGLAGIEVWTEDGEVATTDATGKFSFTNLRPGRHSFRLDPRSLTGDYRVAGDDIRTVDATGWTTPQVDFRVIPLGARLADISQPVNIEFAARPVTAEQQRDALHARQVGGFRTFEPRLRWDASIRGQFELPVDALIQFSPAVDSATVYVDSALYDRAVWISRSLLIPEARPGTEIRIIGWSVQPAESVTVKLRAGSNVSSARTAMGDLKPGKLKAWVSLRTQLLPATSAMPRGAALQLSLEPTGAAWPDASYVLPIGWRPVVGSTRVGGMPARDPSVEQDAAGRVRLRWKFRGVKVAPITVQITTDAVLAAAPETVTIPRARTEASRSAERRTSLAQGPAIGFVDPMDGKVFAGDRVYVGVKGEPGAKVVLFDGATAIDSAALRMDGIHDFIAVHLARGPHRLRARMRNSWGHERWDSIAVHVTGLPARFEAPARITLAADGRTVTTANIRVLDAWGVPVVQAAYVTVAAQGSEPVGEDADPSSVGRQLLSTSTGRLQVPLRPGHTVGAGVLTLKSGNASATIPLEINPEIRPLTLAGAGSVGLGATPDAYGAITARGRLGARTSVSMTLDSRSLDAGQDVFGRDQDPLEEAQYPILGDASHVATRAASTTWFSARLERGLDWMSFGDVATNDFAAGLTLAGYRRAVSGVAGRLTTGPVTWSGFGSMTAQSLRQRQIRGAGMSGPYELGPDVLPGTEQLRLETRALENPERPIVTQGLTRFVDYQIDYASGVVLFKQPVPAADAQGNPVYVVATFEAASGGERQLVAGGRAALDMNRLFGVRRMDSLRLGFTAVSAEQAVAPFRLVGADLRALKLGGLDVGAEVAYAEKGDSAGFATSAKAGFGTAEGPFSFGASYMSVGREFTNPSNIALRPGTTEIALRSALKVGPSTLRASHSWQDFQLDGVSRQSTRVGLVQSFGRRVELDAGVEHRREASGLGSSVAGEAQSGEAKLTVKPTDALQLWAEGRRQFSHSGVLAQPDFWGIGSAYRVSRAVSLEGSHRFVTPSAGASYAVSSVGVRADVGFGTQAWGSYQLSGGIDGGRNAAVVGINNRMRLAPGLGMNLMFERRVGLDQAAISDPVRAAPFLQPEEDYWAAGLGFDLSPERAPYRLTARGEYKDGIFQSNRLLSLAGDVTFNSSLALLSRQEFIQTARPDVALARRLSSLWGLALRPTGSDRLNVLAKLQWSDERNPVGGGVLVSEGSERKLIGAADVIWSPVRGTELGARYAVRRTDASRLDAVGASQSLSSRADYAGAHLNVDVTRWLAIRGDGRLLVERTSATQRWDAAPSIALRLINGIEIAGGYRFGDLRDPDFSVRGGRGLFLTMSASVTERQSPTAADFWRSRF
ncbi:MAG: hypothetical protein QOH59_1091 [Gemmatimonadales bacterium]|nr:hypothetical protein [Gemmatimonadales bacterium]